MSSQFQLTEEHFINAGYRSMYRFHLNFYKIIKDDQGKRFTIRVNKRAMPSNSPVFAIYEFKTQLRADEPIGHLNVSLSTGIDPNVSIIEELELKLNAVWEKLGKNYED